MKILLIDDQPNIISSLVAGIPWLEMGFSSIFTAQSASAAREIIESNHLDIVISDIEMPNEDGLSLLSWAREKGYDYECILLTAHADFSYAKKAISLNVAEYVLQPAKNEDVIRAVNNALEKIKTKDTPAPIQRQINNFNYAAQNIVIKTLFEEWPTIEASIINPDKLDKRLNSLKQFGIQCMPEWPGIISMIKIRKWKSLPLSASDFLFQYQELINKAFTTFEITHISYYMDESTYFTIFFCKEGELITNVIKKLYDQISSELGAAVRLFYAATQIRFIRNTLDGLLNIENQYALSHFNDVHLIEISQDDLYNAAVGADNYQHYNSLIHEYISEHISDAITRTDLADHLKITPDNVSYIIKLTENMTVKELVTKKKMEHAKAMLHNTKHPISDIAAKCGYDSFAYFSKVYRETYGITPSQERQ